MDIIEIAIKICNKNLPRTTQRTLRWTNAPSGAVCGVHSVELNAQQVQTIF